MNLISIAFTFVILIIILNPQIIFGAYAPDEVEIHVTTDKLSYKHGDILTIKGSGAHSYTIFTEIIDPNGKVIANLMFIASNNGDFSTAWIIPSELQEGKFTVHVWDILKEAKTAFYLGSIPHYQEINSEYLPEWVRNIFIWYVEERISEMELLVAIEFLIQQGIIQV